MHFSSPCRLLLLFIGVASHRGISRMQKSRSPLLRESKVIRRFLFKACSRSECSFAGFACCQEFDLFSAFAVHSSPFFLILFDHRAACHEQRNCQTFICELDMHSKNCQTFVCELNMNNETVRLICELCMNSETIKIVFVN